MENSNKAAGRRIPPGVLKPAQYLGCEINLKVKPRRTDMCSVALGFPDLYEIGMSHQGFLLLYHILNSHENTACERVFLPWVDAWDAMKEEGIRLTTVDSGTPAAEFDLLGISIPHETAATNVLGILDLSGIPLRATERGDSDPIVIAGGSGMYNVEPLAPFIDIAFIGDGEEGALEIADAIVELKKKGAARAEKISELSKIAGVLNPTDYQPKYESGRFAGFDVKEGAPEKVKRRVLADLNDSPLPEKPLVPLSEVVHDRLTLEIARGCTRGCRFCQAGMVYRPVRERNADEIIDYALRALERTGYDEASLLSLSSGDYSCIGPLVTGLMNACSGKKVSVALPSLHVGTLDPSAARAISRVKKTGFTLAPEAGTARLRSVINKQASEDDLLDEVAMIARAGWHAVKLYFMIGLPTETEEDVIAIAELAERIREHARRQPGIKRSFHVTVSAGTFVPKPHTPFQWEEQLSEPEAAARLMLLKRECSRRRIQFKWQDSRASEIEGFMARGDRRVAEAIEMAYLSGARFCSWTDHFSYDTWTRAISESGLKIEELLRKRGTDEPLPWDNVDTGVSREYLLAERERACNAETYPGCRGSECRECGVCDTLGVKMILSPYPAEKTVRAASGAGKAETAPPTRYRVGYTKVPPASFLGHLEFQKVFQRAVRRSGLPVAYSSGYHPHQRLSFGPPPPLGVESESEWLDMELVEKIPEDDIIKRLSVELPGGVDVFSAYKIPRRFLSISGALKEVEYEAGLSELVEKGILSSELVSERVSTFTASDAFPVSRPSKSGEKIADLGKIIKEIELDDLVLKFTMNMRVSPQLKPTLAVQAIFGLTAEQLPLVKIRKKVTTFTYDE